MDFDRSGVGRLSLEDFDRLAQEFGFRVSWREACPCQQAIQQRNLMQHSFTEEIVVLKSWHEAVWQSEKVWFSLCGLFCLGIPWVNYLVTIC